MNHAAGSPTERALGKKRDMLQEQTLPGLFDQNPSRCREYSLRTDHLLVDFSRHFLDADTLGLLVQYAQEKQLERQIRSLFAGEALNTTEQRPALHWAYRCEPPENLAGPMRAQRAIMEDLAQSLSSGQHTGCTGKPIRHVLHIGIGGSGTGTRLLHEALHPWRRDSCRVSFLSNIDPQAMEHALRDMDPESTLCLVCSKSFATDETLHNARSVREHMQSALPGKDISGQFWAVTGQAQAAQEFGVPKTQILDFPDWLGGRCSVWSPVSLSVFLALGADVFDALLRGARAMDEHFRDSPLADNIPVILGLLDVWYRDFFGTRSLACIPYDEALRTLPEHLAQLMMESNGKHTRAADGAPAHSCSPVVWGDRGTDSQHSVAQFLHQGLDMVPVDFLLRLRPAGDPRHHDLLFAHCLAQSQTLAYGWQDKNPHKCLPGNRPSTLILYETLDPESLGALLALYEHRTFVQAALWGINPFDQWGVEYGKKLAARILPMLSGDLGSDPGSDITGSGPAPDTGTRAMIDLYRKHRQKQA